jgi:hypothetical protein
MVWALLLALISPEVRADKTPAPAEKKVEAEVLFREGTRLLQQKQFAEACPKLAESQRIDPAGATLINLALCHEGEGKITSAWIEFSEALVQAKRDKRNDRIKIAREHIEKLEPRLPRLIVRLPRVQPSGLIVERGGVPISEASFGTPIPVDPGEHTLEARAPQHLPRRERVSIKEGETKTIQFPALEPAPESPAPAESATAVASVSPTPLPPPGGRRTAGYIIGGVGLVSLTVGAIFGLRTFSKKSESDAGCSKGPALCSPEGASANEQAYTSANIANVGVGLGLLGVGVGAYLIFSRSAPAAAYRVAPAVGRDGGGLWMQGRF